MNETDELIFERLGKNIQKVYDIIGGMSDTDLRYNRPKLFKAYDYIFQAQLDYKRLNEKWSNK